MLSRDVTATWRLRHRCFARIIVILWYQVYHIFPSALISRDRMIFSPSALSLLMFFFSVPNERKRKSWSRVDPVTTTTTTAKYARACDQTPPRCFVCTAVTWRRVGGKRTGACAYCRRRRLIILSSRFTLAEWSKSQICFSSLSTSGAVYT